MTYFQWYLVLIHALAFLGLSLAGAIARHIYRTWDQHKPDQHEHVSDDEVFWTGIQWTPEQLAAAKSRPPAYGLRVVPK